MGGNVTTAEGALVWLNSQSTMTVLNNNYPSIVTSGLVLNLDASFVSSYPKTGTTWNDLSGSGNTGTLVNGPTFNSDNGGTLKFDGIDDYISLGNSKTSLIQGKTNFTIGIMFKMTTLSSLRGLIGTLNYGCGSNLGLVASSSSLQFYNDTTACYNVTPAGFSIEVGKWIYAVGTYDGTTTRIYAIKDNVLYQGSGTSKSGPTNTFTSDFRVMGNQYPLYFTNGECVMAFVYNRALSQEEVYQNYYAGLQRYIPTNGLVLSLDAQNTNLYATSPTTAYDVSGNDINGVLTNGVQYISDGNGSWSFDGVDDRIVTTLNTLSSSTTWTVWVKRTQSINVYNMIMGMYLPYFAFRSNGSIHFSNRINGVQQNLYTTSNLVDNVWYNITFVSSFSEGNTTMLIYLNGVLQTQTTYTGQQPTTTDNSFRLGTWWSGGSEQFRGNIGEVSIYNRALSTSEITTIFNATKSRYGIQ